MESGENFPEDYQTTRWQLVCKGNKNAFAEVAEQNYIALYHYGTRFTSDRDLIKDCIQDLFLEIWERRETLGHILAIKPYLFQSIRNNLVRRVRNQAIFSHILEEESYVEEGGSPELDWISSETEQYTNSRLKNGIELLPKRQREALYLKYYENLSYDEIASVMGLQRQAVANYLQYGIQKLREYWHQKAIFIALLLNFLPLQ